MKNAYIHCLLLIHRASDFIMKDSQIIRAGPYLYELMFTMVDNNFIL